MDIRKVRYFIRVVELGSISRASADLHIAQPALSKSIFILEDEVQTKLLHRSAQGVVPTAAGLRLFEHGQIILRQLQRAQAEVKQIADIPSGQVVVGMPYSVSVVLAVPLMQYISERLPNVQLQLAQEHSHILMDHILSGRVDIGVIARPKPHGGLSFTHIVEEELFFVSSHAVAAGHRSGGSITLPQIAQSKIILPSRTIGLRVFIDSLFESELCPLPVAHEIDAISILMSCVEAGFGSTIVPGSCVRRYEDRHGLVARSIRGGKFRRTIATCHATSRMLDTASQHVLSACQEIVRQTVRSKNWPGTRLIES